MTSEVTLMERASQACGLEDFGDNDEFLIGLRVLLAAIEQVDLPLAVRDALQTSWITSLETRLRLVHLRRERPQIVAERIEGPLAVIGLPRTGTTALVDLLAQDPAARAPLQWETANLFPPASREHWRDDPRITQTQAAFDAAAPVTPFVALGLHTFGAMLPDECNSFLALDFWSPNLTAPLPLPKYTEWLRLAHLQHPYATHRSVLQHLQAHGPGGRWTLKSPFHAFALKEFIAEYPDAMFVQTHRDPIELLPSMAGLYATIRGQNPDDPARHNTGQELLSLWGTGMERCLAARLDPAVEARVFDVSHRAMTADPLGTLRSVYERFGLSFDAAAGQGAKAWLEHPAQHMSSVKFTLADFGLDGDQVDAAFSTYRHRFADFF
jgi:hypothetical protein